MTKRYSTKLLRLLSIVACLALPAVDCGGSKSPYAQHSGGSHADIGAGGAESSDSSAGGIENGSAGDSVVAVAGSTTVYALGGTVVNVAGGGATAPAGNRVTPNLFVTLLGKTEAEVDAKVTLAVNRYFGIGTGESTTPTVDSGYRCYYELPQSPNQAFIWAADSNDIRSEGMSYGMMLAVQMNLHQEFDKLWAFAQTYMQYPNNTALTAWQYYFRWKGTVDTTNASSWTVTFGATTTPAPDGDEYFAAALYLADQRWGNSGSVNYKTEADKIVSAMLHNAATSDGRTPIIHATQKMVVFVPNGSSGNFTDPSYHLPAFYELFALYGPSADRATWISIAATSRDFLVLSAHPTTGLHSDYATFAGAPTNSRSGDAHNEFRYDAWRVPMNMGVDYAWFSTDAKLKAQAEKYHAFFGTRLSGNNVSNSLFAVDGSAPADGNSGGGSTALTASLAAAAIASAAASRQNFVSNLWSIGQQTGQYRYYQENVYLLGLLAVSGKYAYAW